MVSSTGGDSTDEVIDSTTDWHKLRKGMDEELEHGDLIKIANDIIIGVYDPTKEPNRTFAIRSTLTLH